MQRHSISQIKMNQMRRMFIEGKFITYRVAKALKISTVTSWRYGKEFERIKSAYPERLEDMDFYMPEPPKAHRATPLYLELSQILPGLLAAEQPGVKARPVWQKYRALCPQGYTYSPFKIIFYQWLTDHPVLRKPKLLAFIPDKDQQLLDKWRRSNNHHDWQIAIAFKMALNGANATQIMDRTGAGRKTLANWLDAYRAKGLNGLAVTPHQTAVKVVKRMKNRKDNLTRLLHETPKLHGLNRTSWTITALTEIYNQVYPDKLSYMQVSYCLKSMGCRYKRSRDMLTSQDPMFREKIKKIQRILQRLGNREKFFSIDEFGPVSIKIKGGRTLKQPNEPPVSVPEKQKAKGFIICTAALELSTNQVTYFYSLKKNTFEMIKLIDLLLLQYPDQDCLYLCWDAVSWHHSQILKNYIEDHNRQHKPILKLAPLPSCTQFLNVIESVFGGLAKAVIHNSDYPNVDACKEAISRHFETRNRHFQENPKRAGRKIWGKETVVPKFSATHHCRNRNAMRGAGH